jgi:hypothetical protein
VETITARSASAIMATASDPEWPDARLVPIFRRNHSCGFSMVELEQSAEPFPTSDCAVSGHGLCAAVD